MIQKFKEKNDLNYIYKIELNKAWFTHDAAYSDSKELAKTTISDKILKGRGYEIAINPKYDGYQRGLARMMYKFSDKKTGPEKTSKVKANVNEVLAQELHKLLIKKFKKRKVYRRLEDNIWAACLAEMGSLSSKKRSVKYLLYAIDIFTKYAWVKPLKGKKAKTGLNGFAGKRNKGKRMV